MSTGRPRPLVPAVLTRTIFDASHKLSHAGSKAMRRLICDRFVWPGMSKDIRQWTRSCLSCQRTKVTTHVRAPVQPLPMPSSRFESLHVDLVGPLPLSQEFSYLLTVVDRFTSWPEAIPVVDISAEICARAFLTHWVAIFGVPATLTSDRGRQFVSELWKKTATLLGASTNATTAYHPQANGLVERMHRTRKASLKAKLGSDPNWCDTLPVVLLGMRGAVKQDITVRLRRWSMGSSCVYLVSFSQPQPAVGTLILVLSLTCASGCNRCDRFPQCDMAKRLAVRLCTQSFPLLHTCLCVYIHTSLRFKHPTKDRSMY